MTSTPNTSGGTRSIDLGGVFLAGLAALLVLIVFDRITGAVAGLELELHYKTVARGLPRVWAIGLLFPAIRSGLPYRPRGTDLALVSFALVAALSVAAGGGHWGDVRNLTAAIGLGFLARALFTDPRRRTLLLHYVGGIMILVLARELATHPDLLPPQEPGRYRLVTANANVLGFLFAMMAPIPLAEAVMAGGARRWAGVLYYGTAVLGTLLTFSRMAAAGLVLGTVIVGLGSGSPRRRVLAVGALGLLAFVAVLRPHAWTAARATGDADRPRIMHTSLTLAIEHPLLGIGFGINNLRERFPDRYESLYGERLFRYHSMNLLVDLLVGTGLVGTGLALCWLALLVRDAVRAARAATSGGRHDPGVGRARREAIGTLAMLAAVGVMSLADMPLYHGKLLPILFLLIGYGQGGAPGPISGSTSAPERAAG